MYKRRTIRRKLRGRGIKDWIGKVGSFLKKHKVLSRGASAIGSLAPGLAGSIGKAVSGPLATAGYGRRRKAMGSGFRLSGGKRGRRRVLNY